MAFSAGPACFSAELVRLEDCGKTITGACRVKEVRRNVGRWKRRHGTWSMEWTRGEEVGRRRFGRRERVWGLADTGRGES